MKNLTFIIISFLTVSILFVSCSETENFNEVSTEVDMQKRQNSTSESKKVKVDCDETAVLEILFEQSFERCSQHHIGHTACTIEMAHSYYTLMNNYYECDKDKFCEECEEYNVYYINNLIEYVGLQSQGLIDLNNLATQLQLKCELECE